ncbi:MAG: 30S ribosomal protein S11 [Chloroflexota bacterium]|nr:30S ribosomal protein S11 [Chloroflexota bacterium]
MAERSSRTRRRDRTPVPKGAAHVHATFNNTIITITDLQGETLTSVSGGTVGIRGSRKSTPFAAQQAADQAARQAMDMGMRDLDVYVRGPGSGRDAAIRALQGSGLNITSISDVTPIPHNGPRPPKRRRV